MNETFQPITQLTTEQRKILALPATTVAILIQAIILLHGFHPSLSLQNRQISLGVGIIGILYTFFLTRYLLPLSERLYFLHWALAVINAFSIALFPFVLPFIPFVFTTALTVIIVTVSAILSGRTPTYLFIALNAAIQFLGFQFIPSQGQFWSSVLSIPILSIVVTETILRLRSVISKQLSRLEILNQVTRKIASSIEPHQVISLVSAAIQETLLADSYFVALLEDGLLSLELLYDAGEFFPAQKIPVSGGPGSWVIKKQRSLLLRDLPNEVESYGIEPEIVGKERISLSWMGTPMIAGGHLLGVLAVASYHRHAFNIADLELLESIAQQAALAIDNSRHHAEVEEQSRRDSLTGAYNHGFFLTSLEKQAEEARLRRNPMALIMLDIDFFKQYNDNFGHLLGDQVLIRLTQVIREHIKKTDIIGRWGGEEFAILLPDTNGEQATIVAERIRQTLNATNFTNREGMHVPSPTISQGISEFPKETEDIETLIHLADQRLYRAKTRGRNEIAPTPSHWINLDSTINNQRLDAE